MTDMPNDCVGEMDFELRIATQIHGSRADGPGASVAILTTT